MGEILEAIMVVSFGVSWPMNIIKSYRSRTAKGKSLLFMCFIFFGYICGIAGKLVSRNVTYVFAFYILNLVMVGADLALYFRNRRLDARLSLASAGEMSAETAASATEEGKEE